MIDTQPRLFDEINAIKTPVLKSLYTEILSEFLLTDDLNKVLVKFSSPNAPTGQVDVPTWKLLKISYGSMVFSCRLQSFPGCCGYLVMSALYRDGFPSSFLEPIFKSIFNFANSLHYQCVFTSHVRSSPWWSPLNDSFDDVRETGINERTSNTLCLFYKNTYRRLPTQIYTLPEPEFNSYE